MKQTLFYLPHYLFDGWLLTAWLIVGAIVLAYQLFIVKSSKNALSFIPAFLIVAGVIFFVLPQIEVQDVNLADPTGPLISKGLAIRGYGAFMLLAMVCGVGVTWIRCRQVGFDTDQLLPLAFWMIVLGLVGARLFFVIQKWESFPTTASHWLSIVDMTEGGLVVYGSLIGGSVALMLYLRAKNLSWQVADIIAPGMVLGLALGRIGCLMNGCCYGGTCDVDYPGLAFPAASPPYMQQLADGSLLGLKGEWSELGLKVDDVEAKSLAESRGIKPGDQVFIQPPRSLRLRAVKQDSADMEASLVMSVDRIGLVNIPSRELPDWSLKTHPTQVYSSINAAVLFLFLWFYFPFRRQPGQVYAIMLICYSVGRFLLEMIRNDEAGQFGTALTISQWTSCITIIAGFGLLVYCRGQSVDGYSVGDEKPNGSSSDSAAA